MQKNFQQPLEPTDVFEIERREAELQREQSKAAAAEAEDLKWLASTRRGRRILARLIDSSGVDLIGFSTNAMTMAFVQGRRAEGARLRDMLRKACPESYVLLITEQIDGHHDQH